MTEQLKGLNPDQDREAARLHMARVNLGNQAIQNQVEVDALITTTNVLAREASESWSRAYGKSGGNPEEVEREKNLTTSNRTVKSLIYKSQERAEALSQQENVAHREAQEHFDGNQEAYMEQALIDAQAAGVEINSAQPKE